MEINANATYCNDVDVSGGGSYQYGDSVTVSAVVNENCCGFANWTINGVVVSTDAVYKFIITESVTLIANFDRPQFKVTLLSNDTLYGKTTGDGWYDACTEARVEAREEDCYHFVNWTINGEEVSDNRIYDFEVTEDITLTANFFALDFDTYCATLWCNTFELDLRRLDSLGLEVADCRWYKNGIEEMETQTINQFSYSAGPYATHLLEEKPTWYMFEVITKKHASYCSTRKIIDYCPNKSGAPPKNLVIFPNPTSGNNSFTVENVIEGEPVQIFNQFGICIKNNMAAGEVISMTLDVPSGVYMIRCGDRFGKIVVIR